MKNYQTIEFWQVLMASTSRYVLFAGVTYCIFYIWKQRAWSNYKIQKTPPRAKAITNELLYSLLTIVIFAGVIFLLLFTSFRDHTRIYTDISARTRGYYVISLLVVVLLHDSYFYWTHRLMHWKKLFPWVHYIHHRSHNPTPLAAFSFHPLEALIEIGILPVIAFTLPVHSSVIAIFSLYMMTMNVIGHLGFELFPAGFLKGRISRWFNTSTHHNMHHHYGKSNYGLYFNIWDRLLHTSHPDYEKEFNAVVSQRNKNRAFEI